MTPDDSEDPVDPVDVEPWKPQDPPADFAARVVAAARDEEGRAPASASSPRRALAGLLLLGTLAAGVAVAVHVRSASARGNVVADGRREVRVGSRAVAVLERGAHVTWDEGSVLQSAGEVFWRVEPGAQFVVHAGGADVTVKGTCFRVKVRGNDNGNGSESEDAMAMATKQRNVIAAGAAATLVVVAVYEGRVALSREKTTVELSAGEEGQADRDGARRTGGVAASDRQATAEAPAEHALAKLDRVRADRQRELLRALFSEAGSLPFPGAPGAPAAPVAPVAPVASASSSAAAYPTMPQVPVGDAGAMNIDPKYIQSVVRDDYFPLAKQCYGSALERNPKLAGTIEMSFRILGDPKIGGVVDDVKLSDGTTLDDKEMQTCLRESMMSVTFDAPPEGGEVTVVYPVRFSPEEDDADAGKAR